MRINHKLTRDQVEKMVNRATWPVAFREDCQALSLTPWDFILRFHGNGPRFTEEVPTKKIERNPTTMDEHDLTQDELIQQLDNYSKTPVYDTMDEKKKEFLDTALRQWGEAEMSLDARKFAETILYLCRRREKKMRATGLWNE